VGEKKSEEKIGEVCGEIERKKRERIKSKQKKIRKRIEKEKKKRGHPDLNRGPLDLQSNVMLSTSW